MEQAEYQQPNMELYPMKVPQQPEVDENCSVATGRSTARRTTTSAWRNRPAGSTTNSPRASSQDDKMGMPRKKRAPKNSIARRPSVALPLNTHAPTADMSVLAEQIWRSAVLQATGRGDSEEVPGAGVTTEQIEHYIQKERRKTVPESVSGSIQVLGA